MQKMLSHEGNNDTLNITFLRFSGAGVGVVGSCATSDLATSFQSFQSLPTEIGGP